MATSSIFTFLGVTSILIPPNFAREYIYVDEYLNWFQAMDYCMHHFDTTLATILDDNDISIATNTIRLNPIEQSQIAWIGLEDINNNDEWIWADETLCKLSTNKLCTDYWSQSLMSGHCVYHSINEFEYGFHANDCYDSQPFICNAPNNNTNNNNNNDIGCNYLNIEGHGFPTNKCLL
eukprot:20010_1